MDSAHDVSDPTDWQDTSLTTFSSIDASLRCQVCKDFFTNAVITSCAHTFCSLCIRRCLAADGKCPVCRATEQEVRLRRNVAVQEVADAFVVGRHDALKLARRRHTGDEEAKTQEGRGAKRKREETRTEGERPSQAPRRSSRLQSSEKNSPSKDVMVVDDDDEDNDKDVEYTEPDDGLVACPICSKRMKAEAVFAHLDRCEEEREAPRRPSQPSTSRSHASAPLPKPETGPPKPPLERLPTLNYSLFKDQALRKKLSELGIPSWGARHLLLRRHTEWVNLWNANCDSARPRSRRELLGELDTWERHQGGNSANGGQSNSTIMKKDFDGAGWVRKNKNDFDALIANARKTRKASTPAISETKEAEHNPPEEELSNASNKSGHISSEETSTSTQHQAPSTIGDIALDHVPQNSATERTTRVFSLPTDNGTSHDHQSSPSRGEDTPSIFSPSLQAPSQRSSLHTLSTSNGPRSPVPGFSFEKSQHYMSTSLPIPESPTTQLFPHELPPSRSEFTMLGSAQHNTSGEESGRRRSMSLKKESSLPEHLASLKGIVRKLPMFEVGGETMQDAEIGGFK